MNTNTTLWYIAYFDLTQTPIALDYFLRTTKDDVSTAVSIIETDPTKHYVATFEFSQNCQFTVTQV